MRKANNMASNEKDTAPTGNSAEKTMAHNSPSGLENGEGTQANTAKALDEGHRALSTSTGSEQHNGDSSVGYTFIETFGARVTDTIMPSV